MENIDQRTVLTEEQDGAVARAIELGKRQIQQEIATGRIPPTVTDFATLHDFVDANEFGGLCEDEGEWNRLFPRTSAAEGDVFCEAANRVQDALSQWLSTSAERNALLVEKLIEDALNAACLSVQDGLKVSAGDVAGVFFSGSQKEAFQAMFARYVLCEISWMAQDEGD
ncbi:hypothetical protein [Cupriavidus pinatubonensis]|uniref:Uncharacterized protein n=1 Tax=Cupriavidus pinatubonensis TaxID=248026 RepID=A0ABM8WEN4_9BURK|nr:hypothetical protein [Cupriavidus pinatubonensis]CAG9165538.1 hypothetical protein LMG23994_00732 [Cupriavidus pinatubonensis]